MKKRLYICRCTTSSSWSNEEEVVHRQMGHRWLADLLLQEGRTEEAARHLQQYELLTDTLMEQTDTEALRHINALYD